LEERLISPEMRTKKSVGADRAAPKAKRQGRRPAAAALDRHDPASRPARETRQTGKPWPGSRTKRLPAEIESELTDLVAATGCELVHAEWKGGALVLFIDRLPSGVSLADCEHVAKLASALLDVLDFGNGRYVLEVSSPGLDRQLYRPRDYERFLGRLVRITYDMPPTAEGKAQWPRRTVVARLAEFRRAGGAAEPPVEPTGSPAGAKAAAPGPRGVPSAGEVTLIDDRTGERLRLELEAIRLARLEVEL
jgi:ribosome maturation factor RimP